jgi:hypothetical protein
MCITITFMVTPLIATFLLNLLKFCLLLLIVVSDAVLRIMSPVSDSTFSFFRLNKKKFLIL